MGQKKAKGAGKKAPKRSHNRTHKQKQKSAVDTQRAAIEAHLVKAETERLQQLRQKEKASIAKEHADGIHGRYLGTLEEGSLSFDLSEDELEALPKAIAEQYTHLCSTIQETRVALGRAFEAIPPKRNFISIRLAINEIYKHVGLPANAGAHYTITEVSHQLGPVEGRFADFNRGPFSSELEGFLKQIKAAERSNVNHITKKIHARVKAQLLKMQAWYFQVNCIAEYLGIATEESKNNLVSNIMCLTHILLDYTDLSCFTLIERMWLVTAYSHGIDMHILLVQQGEKRLDDNDFDKKLRHYPSLLEATDDSVMTVLQGCMLLFSHIDARILNAKGYDSFFKNQTHFMDELVKMVETHIAKLPQNEIYPLCVYTFAHVSLARVSIEWHLMKIGLDVFGTTAALQDGRVTAHLTKHRQAAYETLKYVETVLQTYEVMVAQEYIEALIARTHTDTSAYRQHFHLSTYILDSALFQLNYICVQSLNINTLILRQHTAENGHKTENPTVLGRIAKLVKYSAVHEMILSQTGNLLMQLCPLETNLQVAGFSLMINMENRMAINLQIEAEIQTILEKQKAAREEADALAHEKMAARNAARLTRAHAKHLKLDVYEVDSDTESSDSEDEFFVSRVAKEFEPELVAAEACYKNKAYTKALVHYQAALETLRALKEMPIEIIKVEINIFRAVLMQCLAARTKAEFDRHKEKALSLKKQTRKAINAQFKAHQLDPNTRTYLYTILKRLLSFEVPEHFVAQPVKIVKKTRGTPKNRGDSRRKPDTVQRVEKAPVVFERTRIPVKAKVWTLPANNETVFPSIAMPGLIELPPILKKFTQCFKDINDHAISLYLVGGVVRDALLSYYHPDRPLETPKDYDLACNCDLDTLIAYLNELTHTHALTYRVDSVHRAPTCVITFEGMTFDLVPFAAGDGSPNMRSDALRRDARVNACYYNMMNQTLHMPEGAEEDFRSRVLNPMNPNMREFILNQPELIMRYMYLSSSYGLQLSAALHKQLSEMAEYLSIANISSKKLRLKKLFKPGMIMQNIQAGEALGIWQAMMCHIYPHRDTNAEAHQRLMHVLEVLDTQGAFNAPDLACLLFFAAVYHTTFHGFVDKHHPGASQDPIAIQYASTQFVEQIHRVFYLDTYEKEVIAYLLQKFELTDNEVAPSTVRQLLAADMPKIDTVLEAFNVSVPQQRMSFT